MLREVVVALMIAQSSGTPDLPGAPETTFEQRWDAMVIRQQIKKEAGQIATPRPEKHVEKGHRHHRRARHATGCRFGHKVYHNHGKSWRCRR